MTMRARSLAGDEIMHAAIGVERFGLKAFLRLMTFRAIPRPSLLPSREGFERAVFDAG